MSSVATKPEPEALKAVVTGLTQAVAETSVTMMKAQNYHWNVKGMGFGPLHDLFQTIYEDHFTAQDELSERVRALGAHAVGRYDAYLAMSKVTECDGDIDAKTMIAKLRDDQRIIAGTLQALASVAEEAGDMLTQDQAIERGRIHEKFAWLLDAHLQG